MAARKRHIDLERLRRVVEEIAAEMREAKDCGRASDFIPELANVDVHQFGLAVHTCDGDMVAGGSADKRFSIQSISKVFALTLALEAFGDDVWKRVGREPSGDPFNSIIDLERHEGHARNPFINSGALVVVDMLLDRCREERAPDFVRDRLAELIEDDSIAVDESVFESEEASTFTNRALANLAKSFGNLRHDVAHVHRAYVRQCAVELSCRELAKAGRYLMIEKIDAASDVSVDDVRRSRRINALMLTCGQYDGSGDFAYRVGLPAKSGVGGGILAIVPNTASIAVWSPGLDSFGNSLLGTLALEKLSEHMDWSVFGAIDGEA